MFVDDGSLAIAILTIVRTTDVLKESRFDPERCVIDHNNEETIREVRDRGYSMDRAGSSSVTIRTTGNDRRPTSHMNWRTACFFIHQRRL
jgi:hypothetical protein